MPVPLKQLIASQSADLCRCYGVRRLGLFGSVARREERADSDIDFLVEFENLGPEHMADRYFGFIEEATRRFGRPVQVLTPRITRINRSFSALGSLGLQPPSSSVSVLSELCEKIRPSRSFFAPRCGQSSGLSLPCIPCFPWALRGSE